MHNIISELQETQDFLNEPFNEEPAYIEERGGKTAVYLARTGKMFADATTEYEAAQNSEIVKVILPLLASKGGASITVQNTLVKNACPELKNIMIWTERLHKTCVRQLDWCRSVLSKAKADMNLQQYGGGGIMRNQ